MQSNTTCTSICCQPIKPFKTGKPLTSSVFEFNAGAYLFFGALLVEPRAPLVVTLPAVSKVPSYQEDNKLNAAIADYIIPTAAYKFLEPRFGFPLPLLV